MSTLLFTGDKNYLKRSPVTGTTTITGPTLLTAWFTYENNVTITHSLGYIPLVRVYYSPYNDGRVFSAAGDRTNLFEPYANNISCSYLVSSTSLTIYLSSPVSNGTSVPLYWVIYLQQPS
jgi:hypothetical protein